MQCISTGWENPALLKSMLAGANKSNWWIPPTTMFLLQNFFLDLWSLLALGMCKACPHCLNSAGSCLRISSQLSGLLGYLYSMNVRQIAGWLHLNPSISCVPKTLAISFIFLLLPFLLLLCILQLTFQEAADESAGMGVKIHQKLLHKVQEAPGYVGDGHGI